MKRFYEKAEAIAFEGTFAVSLDERLARTPGRRVLTAHQALADAIAEEWDGQGETLDMTAMPLTALHGRTLDADDAVRASWTDTIVRYAGTDLLCYRGDDPALAGRQAEVWQPYLDRVGTALGGRFTVTEGIVAVTQDAALLTAARAFADDLSVNRRHGTAVLTEITGSAVLAIAVLSGEDADAVFAASRLDERFQQERWGEDAEAAATEGALARDFAGAARYLSYTD